MTAPGVRAPTWFYLLAGGVILAGVGGSWLMVAIHTTFGISPYVEGALATAIASSVAPMALAGLWSWGAIHLARRGRLDIATAMLALAYLAVIGILCALGSFA